MLEKISRFFDATVSFLSRFLLGQLLLLSVAAVFVVLFSAVHWCMDGGWLYRIAKLSIVLFISYKVSVFLAAVISAWLVFVYVEERAIARNQARRNIERLKKVAPDQR